MKNARFRALENYTAYYKNKIEKKLNYAWKKCREYLKKKNNFDLFKNSTQTCTFNEDDGTVKMFLRGRPIILNATSDAKETYDVTKVQPAPNKKLKLDWVYGYRGKDCRSNLYQLPTGEMAYFVASVVVLYNVDEQSQRHYIGHTDDVKR